MNATWLEQWCGLALRVCFTRLLNDLIWDIVKKLLDEDCKVFLDLKLHDIPNTVARASVEAGRLGVHMITLHTLGSKTMMKQAHETVLEYANRESWDPPKMLGVTILTSMDQTALTSIGIDYPLEQEVLTLAKSAQEAGLDGIVCSPLELHFLKQHKKSNFVFTLDFFLIPSMSKDCLWTILLRLKYFFISFLKSFEVTKTLSANE